MKVIVVADYNEMSYRAFELLKNVVTENPSAVLGLATGSTPEGMYAYIAKDHAENGTSYAKITSVNLDEYVGLSADHEQSYAYFMDKHLFSKVDIDKNNTYLPNGKAANQQEECDRYNALLSKFVPDLQILGIGSNGHIGFNEPGTDFNCVTHVVKLTDSTIKDNSRLFDNESEVPKYAYSMGIANILNSKKILLMASGANKAKAIGAMLSGDITPECPASALRLHGDVTVIVDEAAAKFIK